MRNLIAVAFVLCMSTTAWAGSILPFEGKWTAERSDCSMPTIVSKTEWRQKMPPSVGPDEVGRIKSIKEVKGVYELKMLFHDTSGDGPENFTPTYKLSNITTDKMTLKPGKDPAYVMTRCK